MAEIGKNFDGILYTIRRSFDDSRTDSLSIMPMVAILFLGIIGVSAIYSAQSCYGGNQWQAQTYWFVLGAIVYFITSLIDYKFLLRYAHIIYAISVIMLLFLWTPLGERRFGALRWINFFGFIVQPSEPAKLGFLIMISAMLAREDLHKREISRATIRNVLIIFAIPMVLVFLQPDLGSALIFPAILFSILFAARLTQKFFIYVMSFGFILVSVVAFDIYKYSEFMEEHNMNPIKDCGMYEKQSFIPLKDYQRNRILAFVAPEVIDPHGVGVSWNLRQSLISVGSGGIFGKGFNSGTQAKLGYLPKAVASNDFVFSVIAEERGLMGGLFVLILYTIIIVNGLRVAMLARDRFGTYMAVGISVMFLMHVCINIGMTLGLMPITGIPLPFLSYGGSFLLICCFLQGVLQSIHRFQKCYD